MSDFEKEHLEDIQSNCFWAGYLIDLPKGEAWKLADGIVEEIKFALKIANGLSNNHEKALPINVVMPSVYGIFKHGMDKVYGYYWSLETAEEICNEMNGDDYYVDELCVDEH